MSWLHAITEANGQSLLHSLPVLCSHESSVSNIYVICTVAGDPSKACALQAV